MSILQKTVEPEAPGLPKCSFSGGTVAKIREQMTILRKKKKAMGAVGLNKTLCPRNQQLKRQESTTWDVGRGGKEWICWVKSENRTN